MNLEESRATSIRVFIVDDHAVVRRGLRSFLGIDPDFEVLGEASNGVDAIRSLAGLRAAGNAPDVVLMDLVMPELDGVATTALLREYSDTTRVVIMTSFGEVEHLRAALQSGAIGFLLKDSDPEDVVAAVRTVSRGQLYIDAQLRDQLVQALAPVAGEPTFTPREREITGLVARGMSNIEIAEALFISERTARSHVSHVLGKLGFRSRIQLALWAARHE